MAPFCCNSNRSILNNQVLGSQSTYVEMNNGVLKINEESIENVDSSSPSSKKDDELWRDILLWLRTAALDPCKTKPPLEKLRRRQILKARAHISLSTTEFPWKKRKLDLLENRSAISPPLAKPNEQSSFASSVSCLINSTNSTERSQQCLRKPSISVGLLRHHDDLSRKRVRSSHFYKSDDSISVASTSEKPIKASSNLPFKQVFVSQAKVTNKNFSPLSESDDSVDSSSMPNEHSQEKHKTARRSPRLQNFIGYSLPRVKVPVGSCHQADIPDWIGPRRSDNSSTDGRSDSRYMGTKVWPTEGKNTEDSEKEGIGKGRLNSCSCYSMGCGGCIKLHVFKKGLQLQDELGTAYFTWKFNEMGEEVSKLWTAKEQQCFETLVRMDPITQSDSFLVPALKRFSGKCRKSIFSYYFNVFVPRRMSKQTRLATQHDNDAVVVESKIKCKNTKYFSGGR